MFVSEVDPLFSHGVSDLFLDDLWSSSEPSLVDQISTRGRL
jgi:hypothetical protein